jgi:hypothetical protein
MILTGFYQRYRDILLLNKYVAVSGIISFAVGAIFTQIYADYVGVGRSLNNSIYTLIIGYVTYIPIFVYLFFRANRVRYRDPTSGALNSRNLIRDIWKLFTAFSGSEVVFILTKTYIHFHQLELGYLEAYEAYFVAELVAWGVYFVSMNTILRAVKMYNIRGNSKSTRTPH